MIYILETVTELQQQFPYKTYFQRENLLSGLSAAIKAGNKLQKRRKFRSKSRTCTHTSRKAEMMKITSPVVVCQRKCAIGKRVAFIAELCFVIGPEFLDEIANNRHPRSALLPGLVYLYRLFVEAEFLSPWANIAYHVPIILPEYLVWSVFVWRGFVPFVEVKDDDCG